MFQNKRISTIILVIFSFVIGCTALANYSIAQNKPTGGRVVTNTKSSLKVKASKSTGKKLQGRNVKNDEGQDGKSRVVKLNPQADKTPQGPLSVTASEFGITPAIRDLPAVKDGLPRFRGTIKIKDNEENEVIVSRSVPGAGGFFRI